MSQLGAGFGISQATAWRYVEETLDVLASWAPGLHEALTGLGEGDHVIVDGTLIPIDRIRADEPYYSTKHRQHGMNVQVIARPDGTPLWFSRATPGSWCRWWTRERLSRRPSPRIKLAEALAVIAEVPPDEEGDEDTKWRAALATRYATVRGFIRLLVDVVDFGAVEAGAPVAKALRQLPQLIGRKKLAAAEVERDVVTGSWRRLVFAAPGAEPGLADQAAYSFCVLEHLHRALRRRDVYARSGDRWGDPRAKLLAGERWESAQPTLLKALGLEAEPAAHLAELASALHGAYHTGRRRAADEHRSVREGRQARLGPAGAGRGAEAHGRLPRARQRDAPDGRLPLSCSWRSPSSPV